MRRYSEQLLLALNENTETIRIGAATVLVKQSPSESRPGCVDRMLWEQIGGDWEKPREEPREKPDLNMLMMAFREGSEALMKISTRLRSIPNLKN